MRLDHLIELRPWRRHSLVLLVGGLVYICVGVIYSTLDELTPRQERVFAIALRVFEMDGWGVIFIVVGLLAVASARWPAFSDSWGYGVLTGLSSGWSTVYILGYFFGSAPISNLTVGALWLIIACMWWAISGLINPEEVIEQVVSNGST